LSELDGHLATCAECRGHLAKLRAISGGIEAVAAGLVEQPPAGQRRALLAAMERRAGSRVKSAYRALAIAASVVLAIGISFINSRPVKRPAALTQMAADGFIALPYSDESLSGEGAVVMQVEVPRSAQALAGMPVSDGPADGRVKAEVLVGADGLARAIRFLN
jgi:anti-sigma factor RsiW